MVLGSVAVAILVLSFGLLFFLAAPLAVAGLALGISGRARVRRGETAEGAGAATAALFVGIAGIVLSVVGLGFTLLFLGGFTEH